MSYCSGEKNAVLPPHLILDPLLTTWLQEDIGRGDRATLGLGEWGQQIQRAYWVAKAPGRIAGLPVAQRVFQLLEPTVGFQALIPEGATCESGMAIAALEGTLATLLMGERVALNLTMRLSGIATATQQYVARLADLPTQFVDTRKTTPGLRILEKYASWVGGAVNHRMGLDDSIMLKDNHIVAAGGILAAVKQVRQHQPYPLTIEVETENLDMVKAALDARVDIIMLDNMSPADMAQAVAVIRDRQPHIKIEASGNITLETIRAVAETGVDYISSSAPITQSPWLDLSMRIHPVTT
jgi:nicotinate-nucleotide pyrophosphorylase (carboxylating)